MHITTTFCQQNNASPPGAGDGQYIVSDLSQRTVFALSFDFGTGHDEPFKLRSWGIKSKWGVNGRLGFGTVLLHKPSDYIQ